jgi:hypothetical protein
MEISDEKKVDVILSLLQERYNASHAMRERSERLTIWIVGLAFTVIWFLLLKGPTFTSTQKVLLSAVVAVIGGLVFWHQVGISKGFHRNRTAMIVMEEALGAYEEGLYVSQKALLPADYPVIARFPSRKSLTYHFVITYLWIAVVLIVLILLILLTPTLRNGSVKSDPAAEGSIASYDAAEKIHCDHPDQFFC